MVERMRKLIELGFTQQSIAEGIGVSKASVNYWVKGTKNMSAANEQKFNTWLLELKRKIAEI